jgi:hypothetical protein
MNKPEHSQDTQGVTGTSAARAPASFLRRRSWMLVGAAATVGLVLVGIGSAYADRGWGGQGGWREGGWREGRMMDRGARFQRFCSTDTARWQPVARLYVKTDLRLSTEQSVSFDRLADQVLPALEDVKREACSSFAARAGTAPERLRALADVLKKAADVADKAVEPAQAFYTSLDDAQKARVEEVMARRRGMMGPR